MADLPPEQVRSLAAAIGLAISDEDLEDVTFRLNAILERLRDLDGLESAGPPTPLADAG